MWGVQSILKASGTTRYHPIHPENYSVVPLAVLICIAFIASICDSIRLLIPRCRRGLQQQRLLRADRHLNAPGSLIFVGALCGLDSEEGR